MTSRTPLLLAAALLAAVVLLTALLPCPAGADTGRAGQVKGLTGPKDAVLLAGPEGKILMSVNPNALLVPASTLKLLTALTARHYLTEDHRFQTEFYVRKDGSLIIKGYGDPLLVSEEIQAIAGILRGRINRISHLVLDDTYFAKPLIIPGTRKNSPQPYDAPCGALCANFNSVSFSLQNGHIFSPEPQTPMVAAGRARALSAMASFGLSSGRVPLSPDNNETTRYAGELFDYFLREAGIRGMGDIEMGRVNPVTDVLVYRHVSSVNQAEIIRRLMKSSSNFMANQLLLASGVAAFGPPATLEKGVMAATTYADKVLGVSTVRVTEGSGISRDNRLSAAAMMKILRAFEPHCHLLRYQDGEYYKTGTLDGVRARAGYLTGPEGGLYPFVVIINTPGKDTGPVMGRLKRFVR